ncbi:MAG: FGGY family carbohydrate kinase [Minisyncoccia bacterium]
MNSLVLDVGTTNIKAFIFDESLKVVSSSSKEITKQEFDGKIEQAAKQIISTSIEVIKKVVADSNINPGLIVGMGMTVQRETIIVWDKKTGEPVHPAILWEDNRTKKECADIQKNSETLVRQKTGLSVLPYFSASKIAWIFKNVNKDSELIWGTVDTWIMWNLLKEKPHITDYTNASRTMLFNINNLSWDKELLDLWNLENSNLPSLSPSISNFGTLDESIVGAPIPLIAVCGDQQASMYGALKQNIKTKITFGTGTFLVQALENGFSVVPDFFTTLLPTKIGASYALEAKIGEYGRIVADLLRLKISLENITKEIAESVKPWIAKLPFMPKEIIVDGGITQSPFLLSALRSIYPNISFVEQSIFEGTALGVAHMVFDSLRTRE